MRFVDHPDGQLFDLDTDPGETLNRWNDLAADAAAAKLRLRETLLGGVTPRMLADARMPVFLAH